MGWCSYLGPLVLQSGPRRLEKLAFLTRCCFSWVITRCDRKYMLSVALGVVGVCTMAWARGSGCRYTLHGYDRSRYETRLILAMSAISLCRVEDVLLELLKDDRLLTRSSEWLAVFHAWIEKPAKTSDFIYGCLALLVGQPGAGQHLRSLAEAVSVRIARYTYGDVSEFLKLELHSIIQDDIDCNLNALKERQGPFVDCNITQRSNLLTGGYSQYTIKQAILLWRGANDYDNSRTGILIWLLSGETASHLCH